MASAGSSQKQIHFHRCEFCVFQAFIDFFQEGLVGHALLVRKVAVRKTEHKPLPGTFFFGICACLPQPVAIFGCPHSRSAVEGGVSGHCGESTRHAICQLCVRSNRHELFRFSSEFLLLARRALKVGCRSEPGCSRIQRVVACRLFLAPIARALEHRRPVPSASLDAHPFRRIYRLSECAPQLRAALANSRVRALPCSCTACASAGRSAWRSRRQRGAETAYSVISLAAAMI